MASFSFLELDLQTYKSFQTGGALSLHSRYFEKTSESKKESRYKSNQKLLYSLADNTLHAHTHIYEHRYISVLSTFLFFTLASVFLHDEALFFVYKAVFLPLLIIH